MKKFLCVLLIAATLFSLNTFPTVSADKYSQLCDLLSKSCVNNEEVDISGYGLNEDTLDAAFVDVWYSGRLPWNVESYNYTINTNGAILSFAPIYYNSATYDAALYQQAVDRLFSQVILDGMTQWEMALAVHDYLIVSSAYDETLARNTNYDLLVNGSAVCSGYAMAYLDIMTRLGIECRFVESQPMLHAWNLVKIDGQWYHVDVTHDDPSPDSYGYVSHDHFLKTDKEMEEMGYHGWDTDISCTSEAFADPYWANCNSMIIFTDQAKYMRVNNEFDYTVCCQSRDLSGENADIYTVPAKALTLEKDAYLYETSGLSLWDGRLWFSSVDQVWSMLPDGTDVQTVFRYDIEKNKKFIYSSYVNEGILYLTLSDGQYQFSSDTVQLADSDTHIHNYVEKTLASTCTEEGRIIYICQCGACYDADTVPATGHTYDSYISQPATCQQAGEKTYLCKDCGDIYTETYSDPTAHRYESIVVKEASFFKEGTKYLTCQLCGYVSYESMAKLSFQKQFGLTIWSTLSVIALFISIPILIASNRKKKK